MNPKDFLNDKKFDGLYPEKVQKHSFIHWTPIEIIETAIDWLQINEKSKVLDIGSGAGKFCLLGSLMSKASFTGVEKRKDLSDVAIQLSEKLDLKNVSFINSDLVEVDFNLFNAFYYYNPFCEYIAEFDRIDETLHLRPRFIPLL